MTYIPSRGPDYPIWPSKFVPEELPRWPLQLPSGYMDYQTLREKLKQKQDIIQQLLQILEYQGISLEQELN